jgi:hypothetical protein
MPQITGHDLDGCECMLPQVTEHGQLKLVPLPNLTKEQCYTLRTHPERILRHEYFLPGGPSGYQRMQFPYTWQLLKAFPPVFKNVRKPGRPAPTGDKSSLPLQEVKGSSPDA